MFILVKNNGFQSEYWSGCNWVNRLADAVVYSDRGSAVADAALQRCSVSTLLEEVSWL